MGDLFLNLYTLWTNVIAKNMPFTFGSIISQMIKKRDGKSKIKNSKVHA